MEKETFMEEIEISYDGIYAGACRIKGENNPEKALQLLNYMKGKGYDFIGTSTTIAYFKKEDGKKKK